MLLYLVVDSVGTTDPPPGNTDPPPGNTDPPPGTTKPLPTFPLVPVVAGSAGLVLVGICMAAVLSCICCCCNRYVRTYVCACVCSWMGCVCTGHWTRWMESLG